MYKITLENGSVIDNLVLNGNNYISQDEIDDTNLQGILNEVVIEDENQRVVYEKLKLISHIKVNGRSWLVFCEPSIEELRKLQIDTRFDVVEQEQDIIIDVLSGIMGV